MDESVRIVEVGPRDGLQNISRHVPTKTKIQLIQRLHAAGLENIELTSLVSPKAVPQLKDGQDVLKSPSVQSLLGDKSSRLPILVPNTRGAEIARKHAVSEVAVFVSATEGFSKANINCTVDEGIARAKAVAREAKAHGLAIRGYISCIFADPFIGPTDPAAILRVTRQLLEAGCYEVSLGDTTGVGSPSDVNLLFKYLTGNGVPLEKLAGHFHDTYGQALANVWQAYQCGVRVFDSSVAGLGGCPFAPGARGNVATEDLVYMFHRAGVSTGVDLGKLVDTGLWISDQLSQPTSSRAGAALATRQKPKMLIPNPGISPLTWELVRETEGLLVHRSGANLRITMNRPRNGNALTSSMIADITTTFTEASNDPTVNRVAITGQGKFFCTGMDLSKEQTPVGTGESSSKAQFQRLISLFEAIDNCTKTTISCLNGPAFGGGVGLAFCCDIRLFAKDAAVTLSEAKLGLCPATISRYVIRELGIPFAREAMLTARPILPAELKSKGIIMNIADDASKLATLLDSTLRNLRVASPDASRMCKSLVKAGWAHGGQEKQDAVIKEIFSEMMKPDAPGSYGVKEFQAGRKVDWDSVVGREVLSKL